MARKRTEGKPAPFTKDNLPDSFCAVPFASLIFNPWGNVGSCREQGNQLSMGDVREQNWKEIWNGERLRAWRREFLTGKIKTCEEHIRHRYCNKSSMNQALLPLIELSEVQSAPPQRVSPDFNGQCNLECPMCQVWKEPNGLYDELNFWEDATKTLFPFLKQMDPLAGEPFIQKDTYRLIDIMARVNPTCEWRFTTNAHWKFTPFIREKLDKIVIREFNISIDSIDEQAYARIRKKGNLRTVLKTIEDVIAYRDEREKAGRGFALFINTTIQLENWRELGEFIRFVEGKRCLPCIQFLYEPVEFSVLSLPEPERVQILEHYLNTLSVEEFRHSGRVMMPIVDSLPEQIREKYAQRVAVALVVGPSK